MRQPFDGVYIPDKNGSANVQACAFRWLSRTEMQRTVCALAMQWAPNGKRNQTSNIGDILCDVWSAERGLIAFPEIGILRFGDRTVGVLEGGRWTAGGCYFIHQAAVHPYCRADTARSILEGMVEEAMDRSIDEGFHGWVACEPASGTECTWRALRFSKSGTIYRRMGYFA